MNETNKLPSKNVPSVPIWSDLRPQPARRRRPGRRRRRGLTLIEILVVVTILGLIAGIVGITVVNQLEEAKNDTTRVQMKNVADALELYKIKNNRYPNTAEGLGALTKPPAGKPLMEIVPHDGWDQEFIFVSPGTHNQSKFDIQSKGPDGIADTEDDIRNW